MWPNECKTISVLPLVFASAFKRCGQNLQIVTNCTNGDKMYKWWQTVQMATNRTKWLNKKRKEQDIEALVRELGLKKWFFWHKYHFLLMMKAILVDRKTSCSTIPNLFWNILLVRSTGGDLNEGCFGPSSRSTFRFCGSRVWFTPLYSNSNLAYCVKVAFSRKHWEIRFTWPTTGLKIWQKF